jgi:hypothetical protein
MLVVNISTEKNLHMIAKKGPFQLWKAKIYLKNISKQPQLFEATLLRNRTLAMNCTDQTCPRNCFMLLQCQVLPMPGCSRLSTEKGKPTSANI